MYASVIPAVKMPRGFREFDYEIPEALLGKVMRGSLVEVPWRRKQVLGLITEVSREPSAPNLKLKPVTRLVSSGALPDDFVALFEWLPNRTFSSPAQCLRAFLPSFTKKLLANGLAAPAASAGPPPSQTRRTVCYRTATDKMNLITDFVREHIRDGQVLVLAPHQSDAKAIERSLTDAAVGEIAVALGATTTKNYREAWLSALTGTANVVVGTRSASTFPLPNLAAIIVTESDSRDHRQYDQNPRFDAREIAVWRAEKTGARLTLASHAPRPEDFLIAEPEPVAGPPVSTEVILANVTRREKFEAGLSNSGLKWTEKALQNGKKVLIFHNRLGEALAIFCKDCSKPLQCQRCEIALRQHGNELRCHRCRSVEQQPDTCPACGGISLSASGGGSGGLTKTLAGQFPEARIHRLDSESEQTRDIKADIIIGTQLAVHELGELPGLADGIGTVIATDTDELLSHPGFRTTEQAWRTVTNLKHLAADGHLILETLDPENPRLRRLLDPPSRFLSEELKMRTEAKYPPASDLITVTVADASEAAGKRDLERLRLELSRAAGPHVSLSRPLSPNQPYRHGKWRWVLAVRHASTSRPLLETLARLPEQYLVERDPDSIT